MRWAGHIACKILAGKREGKRPLGRPSHTWEDNIKMDLKGLEYEGMGWKQLAQDRPLEGCCKQSDESLGSIKCQTFLDNFNNCQLLKDSAAWS
jgi:hypothetical protein